MTHRPSTQAAAKSISSHARDAELSWRAILSGFVLGGLFSVTNLYVSAKSGAAFGMGMTASIFAFSMFHVLASSRPDRGLHVLENNMIQTIAGAGGFMASAFTSNLAAWMVVQDQVLPWWQAWLWCVTLSGLGLVMAIPQKPRFVNDLSYPFPEGQACASVLATLHHAPLLRSADPDRTLAGDHPVGVWKPTTALLSSALAAGLVKLLQTPTLLNKLRLTMLYIPEELDEWYLHGARKFDWPIPQFAGIPWAQLTIRPSLDIALFAVGGMMGIRLGISLLGGAVLNYCILVPWMIRLGAIPVQWTAERVPIVGYRAISAWSLWSGVAMMTMASLTAFMIQWLRIRPRSRTTEALAYYGEKRQAVTGGNEMPAAWFWIGLLAFGPCVVWMAWAFFAVPPWLTVILMPLIFVMAAVGIHATALTSITPTGAVARVAQLCGGALAPRQATPNIVLGSMTSETTLHASNFCQHLRPGYLLGANPKAQAVGHLMGAVAGALVCVPVFYGLFLRGTPGSLINDAFPFPAANVWIGVSKIMSDGLSTLPRSAAMAAVVSGILGVLLVLPVRWRLPVSPVGLGLAFLIPFHASLAMFAGAAVFWWFEQRAVNRHLSVLAARLHQHRDVICAGLMVGAALVGIAGLCCENIVR